MKQNKLTAIIFIILLVLPPFAAAPDTSIPGVVAQAGANVGETVRQGLDSLGHPQDLGEPIIVNVASYEPTIVRSAQIEQNDVPVFVHLEATSTVPDFNQPDAFSALTNIPPIRDITILPSNNTNMQYVRNFRYIRPPQNQYSKNNLGYLLVNLKKLKNETDVPPNRTINLELQAKIFFDSTMGGILGISEEEKTLREESAELFASKADKTDNAFFNKRAYVRAIAIDENEATFQIYNKNLLPLSILNPSVAPAGTPVATVRLHKGQTTENPVNIQYSGNPLEDLVLVKLNDITGPQDAALVDISVNGKTFNRKITKDQVIYPGSQWVVVDLQKADPKTISFADAVKEFQLTPTTTASLTQQYGQNPQFEKGTYTIKMKNKQTNEIKTSIRSSLQKGGKFLSIASSVPSSQLAEVLEEKYCPNTLIGNNLDFACEAVKKYKQVLQTDLHSQQAKEAYQGLYDVFSGKLIDYPPCDLINNGNVRNSIQCNEFLADMAGLTDYYAKILNDEGVFNNAVSALSGSGGLLSLPDEGITLQLNEVKKIEENEKGNVKLRFDGKDSSPIFINQPTGLIFTPAEAVDPVIKSVDHRDHSKDKEWVVTELHPSYIKIQQGVKKAGKYQFTGSAMRLDAGAKTQVPTAEKPVPTVANSLQQKEVVYDDVTIVEIKTQNEAFITIIPGSGKAFSTSTFKAKIAIDKRPFTFTPQQLQSQINATQKTIASLDGYTNKLDSLVKNWKKVCLGTFAAVVTKNLLFQGTTRAVARTKVSEFYNALCKKEIGSSGKTLNGCLTEKAADMKKDVDASQAALDEVTKQLKGKKPSELEQCGSIGKSEFDELKKLGATYDECKEYLYLGQLKKNTIASSGLKADAEQKYDKIGFETKIHLVNDQSVKQLQIPPTMKVAFGTEENAKVLFIQSKTQFDTTPPKLGSPDPIELKQIRPNDPADPSKGFSSFIPAQLIQNNSQITQSATTDLVQLNKLQYDLFNDPKNFKDGIIASVQPLLDKKNIHTDKEELNLIAKELQVLEKVPTAFYVDKSFLKKIQQPASQIQTTAITLKPEEIIQHALSSFNIIVNPPNAANPLTKKDSLPSNFSIYTSSIYQDPANRFLSNEYEFIPGSCNEKERVLYAQVDENNQVYCYPTGENGEYILAGPRLTGTKAIDSFTVLNVGADKKMDCGNTPTDDEVMYTASDLNLPQNKQKKQDYQRIINAAGKCDKECHTIGHVGRANIPVKCSKQASKLSLQKFQPQCTDVMEPDDCKLLFNACDPVLCPPSRCNLGGKYQVNDVVQSGIVGSVALCLPNINEGIYVPVCLTGIDAGLKNIRSVLDGYKTCLEVNLKEGKNVGFCDYIRSVGVCELVWREGYQLLNIQGGVIDWLTLKLTSNPQGGVEYYNLQQNIKNAGDSFNVFTNEYSTSFLAYYKGKSLGDIGTQLCRVNVGGNPPSIGEIIDKLSEPENPPQYTAFFEEAPYARVGEVPFGTRGVAVTSGSTQKLSIYKTFYHVYAGTGYAQSTGVLGEQSTIPGNQPNKAVSYAVFLRNKNDPSLPPIYVTVPGETFQRVVNLEVGKSRQESVETVGPVGYNEVCIVINGKESCGFGKVSSSFGLNEVGNYITQAEALQNITSASQCITETQNALDTLGALAPGGGIVSTGIVRVCNPTAPSNDQNKWKKIGVCGKDNSGLDQGSCWLDQDSISISDKRIEADTRNALAKVGNTATTLPKLIKDADAQSALAALNALKKGLLNTAWSSLRQTAKKASSATGKAVLSLTIRTVTNQATLGCRVGVDNCIWKEIPQMRKIIDDFAKLKANLLSYTDLQQQALNPQIALQALIEEADGYKEFAQIKREVEKIQGGPKETAPVQGYQSKTAVTESMILEIDKGAGFWNRLFIGTLDVRYHNSKWQWSKDKKIWNAVIELSGLDDWYQQIITGLEGKDYWKGMEEILTQVKADPPQNGEKISPKVTIYQNNGVSIVDEYTYDKIDDNKNNIALLAINPLAGASRLKTENATEAEERIATFKCNVQQDVKQIEKNIKPYIPIVNKLAIDEDEKVLLLAIMATESSGVNTDNENAAGAKGLMQFIASSAVGTCFNPSLYNIDCPNRLTNGKKECCVCIGAGCATDGRDTPEVAIAGAEVLLNQKIRAIRNCPETRYSLTPDTEKLASIAAYNGGEAGICNAIKQVVTRKEENLNFWNDNMIFFEFYNQNCNAPNCKEERRCYTPKVLYFKSTFEADHILTQ
ncbi:transglycosylase SLT domain-containing protein [Candidatus Woesearchaeota archaeon]|nr:transglycosylase SLT domain-containing protein [Candidatus Woesearchaeota archaeon]